MTAHMPVPRCSYHVDPHNCTDFNRDHTALEVFLLFCICVAGKRASVTARKVNALADRTQEEAEGFDPTTVLHEWWERDHLTFMLKQFKLGKYSLLERSIPRLIGLNLRTCTIEDLEEVPGIGMKTARYFLVHTRPDMKVAALDTHILRFMREELGIPTPKTTPTGDRYLELERKFLTYVQSTGRTVAEVDLEIWKRYTLSTPIT